MELTKEMIFDCELKKQGVTGIYPEKDNCYKVLIENKKSKFSYTCLHFPKPLFYLWEQLHKIRDNLSIGEVKIIIDTVSDYGEWKYTEASNDVSLVGEYW